MLKSIRYFIPASLALEHKYHLASNLSILSRAEMIINSTYKYLHRAQKREGLVLSNNFKDYHIES